MLCGNGYSLRQQSGLFGWNCVPQQRQGSLAPAANICHDPFRFCSPRAELWDAECWEWEVEKEQERVWPRAGSLQEQEDTEWNALEMAACIL